MANPHRQSGVDCLAVMGERLGLPCRWSGIDHLEIISLLPRNEPEFSIPDPNLSATNDACNQYVATRLPQGRYSSATRAPQEVERFPPPGVVAGLGQALRRVDEPRCPAKSFNRRRNAR